MEPEYGNPEADMGGECGSSGASSHPPEEVAMDPDIWSALPQTLLESIFARLPLRCIVQLRLLSKHWRAHITSPSFQQTCDETHTLRFAVAMDSPKNKIWAFDAAERQWHALHLDYIPFLYLVAADGGLLCFVKYTANAARLQVLVCNPLTRAWRELPPLPGVEAMPEMFYMAVDAQARQYTITLLRDLCATKPQRVHVYDSATNLWEIRGHGAFQGGVVDRYILVDCCYGIIHMFDTVQGADSSVPLPPDFEPNGLAQGQGFFPVGAEHGRLFLQRTDVSRSRPGLWEHERGRWKEFCRVPRADDLGKYFFSVFVRRDAVILLGERRELFYSALPDEEDEDEGKPSLADRDDTHLMLVCDMSTKRWSDVTDSRVVPGSMSRFCFQPRLDAVP